MFPNCAATASGSAVKSRPAIESWPPSTFSSDTSASSAGGRDFNEKTFFCSGGVCPSGSRPASVAVPRQCFSSPRTRAPRAGGGRRMRRLVPVAAAMGASARVVATRAASSFARLRVRYLVRPSSVSPRTSALLRRVVSATRRPCVYDRAARPRSSQRHARPARPAPRARARTQPHGTQTASHTPANRSSDTTNPMQPSTTWRCRRGVALSSRCGPLNPPPNRP